jgi:hypothetical protein
MSYDVKLYSKFPLNALKALVSDLNAGGTTVKVALCNSSFVPAQDSDAAYSDITNELATAGGYTAGGAAIGTKTVAQSGRVTTFDGDDVQWTSATFTARIAVIYDDTPALAANKKLIGYIDFAADKSVEAGTFKITWNASGIFTITVAA